MDLDQQLSPKSDPHHNFRNCHHDNKTLPQKKGHLSSKELTVTLSCTRNLLICIHVI